MSTVSGVAAASPVAASTGATGPVSVATALATLRLKPGSTVEIADSLANIQKNLDTLQAVAGRITGLASTDAGKKLTVSAAQYQKDAAILAKWGAGDGNSVDVSGVSAANAATFAAARAAWVGGFTVADSSANLARHLDSLQTLVSDGSLRQIVHTGAASPLKISAAQLAADGDALAAIKNQAYSLAITNASVSDTLGLDGQTALTANARIKSIDVKDSTAVIEQNLDALQRVGLRLRSIAQTDADTALTVSASQMTSDALAIGKILTPYHLEVIRASAAQVAKLAANQKVLTVSVSDTAANIARRWSLMDRLADSLTAIEVTDSGNPIALTADQLSLGEDLLAKFADDADHGFTLTVSGAKAGQAAAIASHAHVAAVSVTDSADNVAANFDDLVAANASGLLQGVTLAGRKLTIALDASRLQGDQAAATQGVLDRITQRSAGVAVTGASMSALDDLAGNARVTSIELVGSSDEIEARLDTLQSLGRRLARIEQTDGGTAIDLSQAQFDTRAGVLAKVDGGYTVNISGATAGKALLDAMNSRVASITVADSGRNLVTNWRALRSIGGTLAGISKTDGGALALTAGNYLLGQNDGLTAKFAADQRFTISGASVEQARQIGADDAVEQIDVVDDGSAVTARLDDLAGLAAGGKLHGIVLNAGTTRLALHASQLDAAQAVLDKVKDGRYSLALDEVGVGNVSDLLAGNAKIATVRATGDAAGIVGHLAELSGAGRKLLAIARTDTADTSLALSGADFESHRATLDKITGGYFAELSDVAAAKAAGLAGAAQVKSLRVADSGANLAAAWNALGTLGAKLGGISQSDASLISLSAAQWAGTRALGDKFATPLALSISGAGVADLASLGGDTAVQQIQLSDSAEAITAAWSTLAGEAKLTQLQINDPGTALEMSAATYAGSSELLGRIRGGAYSVALSEVAVGDAATLQADAHVSALDVTGSSTDIAASFDTLAGLGKLGSLTLSDDNGTLALSAAQVLGGADTLGRIGNAFRIAASDARVADLADLQAVDEVAQIGVSDSAQNVAAQLDDLVALGGTLGSIHLGDDSPVLALTQADWSTGTAALAKIDGSYQVDLSQVEPDAVQTLAADASVRQLAVAGTAGSIAQRWSTLVAAYADGAGKLTALALTDDAPLALTQAQQDEGAAMIAALLPDETLLTLG